MTEQHQTTEIRTPRLPLCPTSDLPRVLCDHCDSFTLTEAERAYLNGDYGPPVRPAPRHHLVPARFEYPDLKRPPEHVDIPIWHLPAPKAVVCDHGHGDDRFICDLCAQVLFKALGDVPGLVADLELARSKEVTFLEQGVPADANPDESTVPFNRGAGPIIADMWRTFGGDPAVESRRMWMEWRATLRRTDIATVLTAVTSVVARAHRLIDRPPTLFEYGPCPTCEQPIVQERLAKSDTHGRIVCVACGYTATLNQHEKTQIGKGEDQWRTADEVLEMLRVAGISLTAKRLQQMIDTEGLPRETRVLFDDNLNQSEEPVYRLRDVRDILDDAVPKLMTLSQCAATLDRPLTTLKSAAGTRFHPTGEDRSGAKLYDVDDVRRVMDQVRPGGKPGRKWKRDAA